MIGFCRCIFYITFSLVLSSSYFFAMDYFNKIEEKKARLDEYYTKEFEFAYKIVFSSCSNYYLTPTEEHASLDGYKKAEIEIMKKMRVIKNMNCTGKDDKKFKIIKNTF